MGPWRVCVGLQMAELERREAKRYDELEAEGSTPVLDPQIVEMTLQRKALSSAWETRETTAESLRGDGESLRSRCAGFAHGFASLMQEPGNVSSRPDLPPTF